MRVEEFVRLEPGDRLPRLELIEAADGGARTFPGVSRDALILLILPAAYQEWAGYLAAMNRAAEAIRQWNARILIVMTVELHVARDVAQHAAPSLPVFVDDAAARRRLGIPPERGALPVRPPPPEHLRSAIPPDVTLAARSRSSSAPAIARSSSPERPSPVRCIQETHFLRGAARFDWLVESFRWSVVSRVTWIDFRRFSRRVNGGSR